MATTTPPAPTPAPEPAPPLVAEKGQLSDGTRIYERLPRQRCCALKDAKGKLCAGHLKRWYFYGEEVAQRLGPEAEVYRCEKCKSLYLPNPGETPRSGTLCY